jgi:hypothetical protein
MSLTPGLEHIADQYRGSPGAGAVVGLTLEAAVGQLVQHLGRAEDRRRKLWKAVHTIPLRGGGATGLNNFTGVLIDQKDRFGPHTGHYWDVARLSAWGWTAGTVTAYLNDTQGIGEPLAVFTTPGQWTWSSKQMPLAPDDRIVFIGAGVTGAVYVGGSATEVEAPYWADYVGWSVGF